MSPFLEGKDEVGHTQTIRTKNKIRDLSKGKWNVTVRCVQAKMTEVYVGIKANVLFAYGHPFLPFRPI